MIKVRSRFQDENAACTITSLATGFGIPASTGIFFAAFDGTGNDLDNIGNNQPTNVAQLWKQNQSAFGSDYPNLLTGHYEAGPGTNETIVGSSWFPPSVDAEAAACASKMYAAFAKQARD